MQDEQTSLVPALPKLTEYQRAVYEAALAEDGKGYMTPFEAGLIVHGAKGCRWCSSGRDCHYRVSDGRRVLAALARKGLLKMRRPLDATGKRVQVWALPGREVRRIHDSERGTTASADPLPESAQTDDIPW